MPRALPGARSHLEGLLKAVMDFVKVDRPACVLVLFPPHAPTDAGVDLEQSMQRPRQVVHYKDCARDPAVEVPACSQRC